MTAAVAAVGFERIDVGWWLDIAQQLVDAALEWVESAALMDLRFWEGQIRLGRRVKLPSRRQLAARWGWTQHRVRALLQGEGWHDPHHPQPDRAHLKAAQKSPASRPVSAQNSPTSESIAQVQPQSVNHFPPTPRPVVNHFSPHARTTPNTEHRSLEHPDRPVSDLQDLGPEDSAEGAPQAEAAPSTETPLAAVAGTGRGLLWHDLVRDLEAAGYTTLQQLAETSRDTVAADLGRSASSKRLQRICDVLSSHGLPCDAWAPSGAPTGASAAGRPDDGLSLSRAEQDRAWEQRILNNPYLRSRRQVTR